MKYLKSKLLYALLFSAVASLVLSVLAAILQFTDPSIPIALNIMVAVGLAIITFEIWITHLESNKIQKKQEENSSLNNDILIMQLRKEYHDSGHDVITRRLQEGRGDAFTQELIDMYARNMKQWNTDFEMVSKKWATQRGIEVEFRYNSIYEEFLKKQ